MCLALTDRQFWTLTWREFTALKRRYDAHHGIEPPKTWEQERAEAMRGVNAHNRRLCG